MKDTNLIYSNFIRLIIHLTLIFIFFEPVATVNAQGTYTVIYDFANGNVTNDGSYPNAPIAVGGDGTIYGTTFNGGSANNGTLFKISPTRVETIIHNFGDVRIPNDGTGPNTSPILASNGSLYGSTAYGGNAGVGVIYKISPTGVYSILHNFGDGSVQNEGGGGDALVQGIDGNFYGITGGGGTTVDGVPGGFGTVFKMTPTGVVTIIHNFRDGSVTYDVWSSLWGSRLGDCLQDISIRLLFHTT
jgi:uncharacterized repeat protein (TIGR03803 family)